MCHETVGRIEARWTQGESKMRARREQQESKEAACHNSM